MAFGIPVEAQGTAAGVLIYSFLCTLCGALLVWLVWSHHERTSYVAYIAYFTVLSSVASLVQQFHVYVDWSSIMAEQLRHAKANVGNPELVIANSSTGMDLVLFYIQYCCYNIEATFVLFWAFSLTQSVYGWSSKPHLRRLFMYINTSGKVISVVLPIIMISLLQLDSVQRTFFGFLLVADILLIISLAGGCCFVLAILGKYVQSRRQFKSWSVDYGKRGGLESGQNSNGPPQPKSQGIYDRWLLVRFTLGFILLGTFEITNVLFQLAGRQNSTHDAKLMHPDVSAARARSSAVLFLPGVTPPLLAFAVFGTTKPFRLHMYRTFVPKRFQREPEPAAKQPSSTYASHDSKAYGSGPRPFSPKGPQPQVGAIALADMKPSRPQRRSPSGSDDEWPILDEIQSAGREGRLWAELPPLPR
ncbi:hypothetical protein GGR56DRAFT_35051 [Xylariaceae sp. FL0804]|nr:hypothetical protein GGR56DRAFT_35051 [Xylariaceae sp. FL0804]